MSIPPEEPGFLSVSDGSPPVVLRNFPDDTPTGAARPRAKQPRSTRRNSNKKKKTDSLWTPANVGNLDLDAIYRDIRAAALDYAARGWKVIQVFGMVATAEGDDLICACPAGARCGNNSGKHPRGVVGLFERATSDLEVVAQWWDEYPESNVGLVGRDGIGVIIDLDRLKEGETGPDGFKLWQDLQGLHGTAPATFTEDTGSGGQHIFFAVAPGTVIGNSLPVIADLPKTNLGKLKIDVKGHRGYVVAAPSLHQSGRLYQVIEDLPLALAPDWLVGPSLTSSLRNRASVRNPTTSSKTKSPSKTNSAVIEKIMDDLLAGMTDKNAPLTSTTNRWIHLGVGQFQ